MSVWLKQDATYIGRGHVKENIPCQDKTLTMEREGVHVIALADGSSSKSHSHFGAEITVKTLCELMCQRFDEFFNADDVIFVKNTILETIVTELESFAQDNNITLSDLNATLLFAATKDDCFLLGRLGDGYVGAIKNNALSIVSLEKKTGDKASTYYPALIRSFPSLEPIYAQFELKKSKNPDIHGFILLSDGSGESMVDSTIPFVRKFAPSAMKVFHVLRDNSPEESYQIIHEFLENGVTKKTTDDCGIAIMCKPDIHIEVIEPINLPKPTMLDDEHTMIEKSHPLTSVETYEVKVEDLQESIEPIDYEDPDIKTLLYQSSTSYGNEPIDESLIQDILILLGHDDYTLDDMIDILKQDKLWIEHHIEHMLMLNMIKQYLGTSSEPLYKIHKKEG